MIKLPSVFSSGALFQHSSQLKISGRCDKADMVSVHIEGQDGMVLSTAEGMAAASGSFSVTIDTLAASMEAYRIVIACGRERITLENILFGELWFASGQSNMELGNNMMEGYEEYMGETSDMELRVYKQNSVAGEEILLSDYSADFPISPEDTLEGRWFDVSDIAGSVSVSAVATSFVKKLYQLYCKNGEEIPVGFINCTVGGTRIEGWLPFEDIEEDDETAVDCLIKPDITKWNTFGSMNYFQSTAMYNRKVSPLVGIRCRGLIWYQGEANVARPGCEARYKRYLEKYYRRYRGLFAAQQHFPMMISMTFPYTYENYSECRMTCINKAIAETGSGHSGDMFVVPNYDLPPIWGQLEPPFHPVHPINKYPLGERMAQAFADRESAPVLSGIEYAGDRLRLAFVNSGGVLSICGDRLYGLYIRGENTPYLEADGEITGPDELTVWHRYIDRPVQVAYQVSSMATEGNLCGKKLPAAPFSTEDTWNLSIERRSWLRTEKSSEWYCCNPAETLVDDVFDCFTHPIWYPEVRSEICVDKVYRRRIASLRIAGEESVFGAYVLSQRYNELDLQNFGELRFQLFNASAVSEQGGSVSAVLMFSPENGEQYTVTRYAKRISEISCGWAEFGIEFSALPCDRISRLTLIFNTGSSRYHFVNIDVLELVPKTARIG